MKKRLLHIVPDLSGSDANRQLLTLIERLPSEYESAVLSLSSTHPIRRPNRSLPHRLAPHFDVGLVRRLQKQAVTLIDVETHTHQAVRSLSIAWSTSREFDPKVVHVWGQPRNRLGQSLAMTLPAKRRIAEFGSQHGRQTWSERAFARVTSRWLDRVIVDSPWLQAACERGGVDSDKIRMIARGYELPHSTQSEAARNGSATDRDTTEARARSRLRAALGIPEGAVVVATVGPLVPDRNVKDLIWAMDLLKSARPSCYLLVIGRGPHEARLRRFSRQVRVDDRILWFSDTVDNLKWLDTCDALWSASRCESQPGDVFEAITRRIPVIATDIPGHRQLIRHDQTGGLVRLGDRAAFARQLLRLLDDDSIAQRWVEAAVQNVASEHSIDSMVQSYLEEYES